MIRAARFDEADALVVRLRVAVRAAGRAAAAVGSRAARPAGCARRSRRERRRCWSPTWTAPSSGICTVYLDLDSVRFGQRAWVEDLAVDPEHRSAGIGKQLLDAAKDWGRSRGATHLELDSAEARADAHRFYEREQPSWRSISFGWEL